MEMGARFDTFLLASMVRNWKRRVYGCLQGQCTVVGADVRYVPTEGYSRLKVEG